MRQTKLDKRFFDSTRGRIVSLLRGKEKTVNELAAALELTDNAVRAHLLSLERDGLVRQRGTQPGIRKPHFAYELTEESEQLFPKAYDTILIHLLTVLKERFNEPELHDVLEEVGQSLARLDASAASKSDLKSRVTKAVATLGRIGGAARVEFEDGRYVICGESCPLAGAVSAHPEVCSLAEALLSELIGAEVREKCDRETTPRCRFEVGETVQT